MLSSANRTHDTVGREMRLAVLAGGAVAALAGVNWLLRPDQAERALRTMLMLPAIAAGLGLWYKWMRRSRPPLTPADERSRQRYFLAALTLMVTALGIRQVVLFGLGIWNSLSGRGVDLELERRILGLASGAVFVVIGNALPKILTPLSILPLRLAERVTRARRFVGAAWVVFGLAMMAAFLVMPLPEARSFMAVAGIASLLTMLGAIVWMNCGADRRAAP